MAWIPLDSLFERSPSSKARGKGKTKAQMVPATVSHCVLAVKKKGKGTGEAWNICRAQLTKQGYLKGPYKTNAKLPDDVRPTSKGVRRGMKHAMEKDAPEKFNKFKDALRGIETRL
ncbi:MAG: hypothetical protein JRG69_07795 [Deltaproteobacteria bacterium]|nr:hypothetical protein [Deltaproteobacteria bacterium]